MGLRPGTAEEAGMSSARLQHVAQLAQSWVEHEPVRTLVVAVARRGMLILHEAFGTLGPEPDSPPATLESIFDLQSVSKPITATAVMLLVEDGLLGLNRPVVEYIPEFIGENKSAVTVFHLLTHTSGLRDEDIDAYVSARFADKGLSAPDWLKGEVSYDEYLSHRYAAPLWKAPGEEMSYSSFGFDLLGEIVQRVSSHPLDVFARERIFVPLGMHDTSYVVTPEVRPRLIRLSPEDWPPDGIGYPAQVEEPWGSGSVRSTALDMARFGQMFLERGGSGAGRVLSPTSVTQMTRNQIPGISAYFLHEHFPEASWGLGWSIEGDKRYPLRGSLDSPATFGHAGSGGIWMWVDPVYDLVGVYLSSLRNPRVAPESLSRWPTDLFMNAVTAAVLDV
jgi:CubicO group peptidase (beta-lactamase class C family)